MSKDNEYGVDRIGNYDFGDTTAPEGFNPDEQGWRDPPVGENKFRVDWANTKVATDEVFNWTDRVTKQRFSFTLNMLKARLVLCDGPDAGASIMTRLPMPTPGRAWHSGLASQWGQFLKALGFEVAKDKTVPAGFSLPQIGDRECLAIVEVQMKDDEVQTKKDGTPWLQLKMFGFRPVPAGWKSEHGASAGQGGGSKRASSPPAGIGGAPAGAGAGAPAASGAPVDQFADL